MLKAASDSLSPDTIHLAAGTYSDSLTGEHFPLSIKSYVTIKGVHRDSVILDAENRIYLINAIYGATRFELNGFTLQNGNGDINSPTNTGAMRIKESPNSKLRNLLFKNNTGSINSATRIYNSDNFYVENVIFQDNIGGKALRTSHSESLYGNQGTVYLKNCVFRHNIPDYTITDKGYGGGLSIIGSINIPYSITTVLYNCLFTENLFKYFNGYSSNSIGTMNYARGYIVNSTFVNNTCENSQKGANIGVTYSTNLTFYNSIMYGNNSLEFYMSNVQYYDTNYLSIYHSVVEGGEEGIAMLGDNNALYYDTTNLDTDPLFYGGEEFPYNLSAESPCIDAGTLDLPQFILDNMPDTDLAGNPRIFNGKIDMGAYEWNPTVDVKEIPNSKRQIPTLTAAPNPFTDQTLISAKWDTPARVNILIYNSKGLLVKTLQSSSQPAGSCQLIWDGTNQIATPLPAGTYIIILTVNGKETGSVKVVKR